MTQHLPVAATGLLLAVVGTRTAIVWLLRHLVAQEDADRDRRRGEQFDREWAEVSAEWSATHRTDQD